MITGEEDLRKAVELNPRDYDAQASLGGVLKRKGDLAGALNCYEVAAQLSDGTLAYLAFIALFRLNASRPSLLALDEPDLHLHPRLLLRVLDFLEAMAREHPVLCATHSDRLLDGLSDPARSAVLCELDESGTTRLLRPDAEALERWLERYRGLGEIRGAGHEASIFTREEAAGAER